MSDPLTLIHGDALSSLQAMEGESVQTGVTSPPYWGLRDYGVDPIVWDNHNGCEHEWAQERTARPNSSGGFSEKQLSNAGTRDISDYHDRATYAQFCNCGAWRGCLGLEPTPEMFVAHLVEIFREVKRVLRKDGTVWLNLGDSYASSSANGGQSDFSSSTLKRDGRNEESRIRTLTQNAKELGRPQPLAKKEHGLKPKDLVGIPWMVAFALRADGWYLRSDIIWSKPNPMPESVTDRPTKSHEYIFLLSKSERYYFDADAVRAPYVGALHAPGNKTDNGRLTSSMGHFNEPERVWGNPDGRNIRSVWTVTTQPFSGAHFATFPPDLIKPCILAGASVGGVVLDPFAGSGTTGKVAIELGRKAVLIEPKAEYVEMIKRRCQTTIGLPL